MSILGYHLGMPLWGFKDWLGVLYRTGSGAADFLQQYATVFNAVEGNTTFYSLPSPDTVARWGEVTPASFRFAFKMPREITHDRALDGVGRETAELLRAIEPLGERVGPVMIQLPATFGPSLLARLDAYLGRLPDAFRYAVELRHPAFCSGEGEQRVNEVLAARGADRVLMDTRAMRSGDPGHPDVVEAAHAKPALPVHAVVTADTPIVRFVGHPEPEVNVAWLQRWSERLAGWLADGRRPYFFVHVPNNVHAPGLARRFHELLRRRVDVGSLPPFPGETEDAGGQLKLL